MMGFDSYARLLLAVPSMVHCYSRAWVVRKEAIVLSVAMLLATLYFQFTSSIPPSAPTNSFHLAQVLAWVVVAAAWSHQASLHYLVFGLLAGISPAFAAWIPLNSHSSANASPHTNPNANSSSSRKIPLIYVFTSVVALLSISSQRYVGVYVVLVVGKFLANFFPLQARVDGFSLYLSLAIATAVMHRWSSLASFSLSSLTESGPAFDLLCCSVLTLYYIFVQSGSLIKVALAAPAIPLVSPAAILAAFLATTQFAEAHRELITRVQGYVAARMHRAKQGPGTWMNLGLWNEEAGSNYEEACKQLARRLGESLLREQDAVLSCGCGDGLELGYFFRQFKLKHITGIDADQGALRRFTAEHNVRLIHMDVGAIRKHFPAEKLFNKIVALDNVYHYPSKATFFRDCFELLPADGQVGVSDIILQSPPPTWLRLALRAANIPIRNQWTASVYRAELAQAGFTDVTIESLGASVLKKWVPNFAHGYLDYAIIVARKPSSSSNQSINQQLSSSSTTKTQTARRRKIAIVGSGLSGLSVANALAENHDVTVFEAREKVNLTGAATRVHGMMVDIPLRMMAQGYYNNVENLFKKLSAPTVVAQTDCHFHGLNGERGPTSFIKEHSHWKNLRNSLPHINEWRQFRAATTPAALKNLDRSETFGSWLKRNGLESIDSSSSKSPAASSSSSSSSSSPSSSTELLPVWLLFCQMSWVLSCSFEQVKAYPAFIVLGFLQALDLSFSSMLYDNGQYIIRACPSVERLQHCLTYNVDIRTNTPISKVDPEAKIVNGEKYDCVVVATEAWSVPLVLHDADPVFAEWEYQPSTMTVHTDSSFMPARRDEWKSFNVFRSPDSDMSVLTIWLNSYYPESKFPTDVFQTWNPVRKPQGIIKEANFTRVLHTSESESRVNRVQALQGRNGIYYAGSYAVLGMGLLEEALMSGQKAVEKMIADFQAQDQQVA